MTELYCDHNIARQLVSLLRRAGYDVLTADEIGLAAAKDDQQLLTAAQRGRTLLTYDAKDFWLLHRAWLRWTGAWNVSRQHRGILLLPQPSKPSNSDMAQAVDSLLGSELQLANKLYRWKSTGWQELR
ncbi:MAG: DUF5615 family PIN-like protein [Thermomicrobiales bacterium]